ncbi:MAG TPA: hypothetical protein VFA89_16160 [Terriglobales bacterium]|nr:hypothetical protein [Terriglobales bacterium]
MSTSNQTPTYELELKAADQRRRLHDSVEELKTQVRGKLDVKRNAREHLWIASGVTAMVSLVLGYGFGGMFTRH